MSGMAKALDHLHNCASPTESEKGFGLAEFIMSALIVLTLSAGIFTILADVESTAGYQPEVLSVMANTRMAMDAVERYISQAGNNPQGAAFTPVTITSSTQVRLCSDLTGSAGGNQGDPDGDILDGDEDVTIQYNSTARSIEKVLADGTVETLATGISAFSLHYFDASGAETAIGANVQRIGVTITGLSTVADPHNRKTFGITLSSNVKLANRF